MPPEQEEKTEINTEDEILNSIGGFDEENTGGTEDTSDEGEGSTQETSDKVPGPDGSGPKDGKDSKGTDPLEKGRQANSPQDLVDKDGKVIAKGGAERRLYERGQKLEAELRSSKDRLTSVETELEAYKSASTLGNQFGLSPQELTTGAQIIASFKQDPVSTIKQLLTQVQAMGHDIEEIGTSGVSMDAIKRMINEAVSPLTSRVEKETEENTRRTEATRVYNEFLSRNPDAETHVDSIVKIMQNDPSMTLDAAYHKLRAEYAIRGLDWSKSVAQLREEAEAASSKPSGGQQGLPSGNTQTGRTVVETSEAVSPDTSFDEIIRASMKEAGY